MAPYKFYFGYYLMGYLDIWYIIIYDKELTVTSDYVLCEVEVEK